jgi:histidinol-phosphate/aromatic aminotransferase/cobyric acid decarboxylase-like protein
MKARGPYKVNAVAERAAVAALESDRGWVEDHIADVVANRQRFRDELTIRGIASLPSAANFVLVPVKDCAVIGGRLRNNGIGVRELRALPGIGDALRVGIGPWEMMERCLDALGDLA